jgi:hypothetical protein
MKIDLILASAGARSEFIDGWLSSLDEYNSKFWLIDDLTGKSIIRPTLMSYWKEKQNNLISKCKIIFERMNYDINKTFSSGYHPDYLINHISEECLKNNNFRFILITQKEESKPKIFWESLIKNYYPYSKNTNIENVNRSENLFKNMKYNYDNKIFVDKHIANWEKLSEYKNITPIEIEYEEIIKSSGSYYLQEKLNLNVTEKDHKYWEEQLQKSHSPLEVECFEKIFKYEDLLC